MKKILITGGAGFLGSHLCDRLIKDSHDILCVDNFFTGSKTNIAHLISKPYFELMRHDVTFPLYVEVDQIYNLACPASPVHYQFDPVHKMHTPVAFIIFNRPDTTKQVFSEIAKAKPPKLVVGDVARTKNNGNRFLPIRSSGTPRNE
jgi:UDP-glucuronate decarboxylase